MAIHLGRPLPCASSNQPGRRPGNRPGETGEPAARVPPLFGLAPSGVCPAVPVARHAVRSYRTLSPLPRASRGGLLSVALSLGLPPPDVIRRCVSMEPGLSSAAKKPQRPSGQLTSHDKEPPGRFVKSVLLRPTLGVFCPYVAVFSQTGIKVTDSPFGQC